MKGKSSDRKMEGNTYRKGCHQGKVSCVSRPATTHADAIESLESSSVMNVSTSASSDERLSSVKLSKSTNQWWGWWVMRRNKYSNVEFMGRNKRPDLLASVDHFPLRRQRILWLVFSHQWTDDIVEKILWDFFLFSSLASLFKSASFVPMCTEVLSHVAIHTNDHAAPSYL